MTTHAKHSWHTNINEAYNYDLIYAINYRSSVKKKAKNKEDFDGEVGKICVSSSGPQPGA